MTNERMDEWVAELVDGLEKRTGRNLFGFEIDELKKKFECLCEALHKYYQYEREGHDIGEILKKEDWPQAKEYYDRFYDVMKGLYQFGGLTINIFKEGKKESEYIENVSGLDDTYRNLEEKLKIIREQQDYISLKFN